MKKIVLICTIAFVLVVISSAFKPGHRYITSIYGSIDPPGSVSKVMAIKEKDTVVVVPHDGRFSIKVTGGIWKLYFVARDPYKDMYAEDIRVTDDRSTDVGVIRLTTR